MLAFMALCLIYLVMTGVSLHGLDGIEDGIITGSLINNGLFRTIEQMRNITIGTNLVGLLLITILFRANLKRDREPDS